MEETKPEGAAVTRTDRTEGVGSWEAREFARGPSERRSAGSVGSTLMPANDALRRGEFVSIGWFERCRGGWGGGGTIEGAGRYLLGACGSL